MARLIVRAFAFLLILAPVPALAQGRLGGGGALNLSLTRIVMALLLCLMLAVLAAFAIRRGGGRIDVRALTRRLAPRLPAERRIEILESRRISQHADVCLIRCDGREYLLLSSAQQQAVLREGDAASDARA